VVALVFDLILVALGRLLLPWSRADRRSGRLSRRAAMKAVAGA
jgi:osmoprotectant transport system permease protein